ncbi:MAG: hypothetical protein AB9903_03645 [Vulcanimicrobiota bacterium]
MKSITVSTDDELQKAVEDEMDEIIIEGDLAERVSSAYEKVRMIKKLLPLMALVFAVILAGVALVIKQAEGYQETECELSNGKTRTILRKKSKKR